MKRKVRLNIISAFLAVCFINALLPGRNVLAIEGGSVTLTGSDSLRIGEEAVSEVLIDAPAEIGFVSLTITYEAEQFEFLGFDSSIGNTTVNEDSGLIYLDMTDISIPQGQSKLGTLTFLPTLEGNARFSVLAASLFTPEEEMVAADTSLIYYVTVNAAEQETGTTAILETEASITETTAEVTSIETTAHTTAIEETTQVVTEQTTKETLENTTIESTNTETSESNSVISENQETTISAPSSIRITEETAVISDAEAVEQIVTTQSSAPANDTDEKQNRLIWVPVILILLAGVTGVSLLVAKRSK